MADEITPSSLFGPDPTAPTVGRLTGASGDPSVAASRGTALQLLQQMLAQYGLGDIADALGPLLANPDYTDSQILIELYKTPAYKARFPALEQLRAKGFGMDEGQYIQMEQSYANILADAGLPSGFYDSREDFGKWMLGDVSPEELAGRVRAAQDIINSSDPNERAVARDYYGIDSDHLLAYAIDPDKAQSLIERQMRNITFGGTARRYGFDLDLTGADSLANDPLTQGLNASQLQDRFSQARSQAETDTRLAGIDREDYDRMDAVDALLRDNREAQMASQRRANRERARFSGSSGTGSSALKRSSY